MKNYSRPKEKKVSGIKIKESYETSTFEEDDFTNYSSELTYSHDHYSEPEQDYCSNMAMDGYCKCDKSCELSRKNLEKDIRKNLLRVNALIAAYCYPN